MAVRPLRPAIDRRFGGPLPRQLANQTRIHPVPINLLPQKDALPWSHAVLPAVSSCYPPVQCRFSTRYSPVRHSVQNRHPEGIVIRNLVRLACVKHAASVHPEPGSNSHVKKSNCFAFRLRTAASQPFRLLALTDQSDHNLIERCRSLVRSVSSKG